MLQYDSVLCFPSHFFSLSKYANPRKIYLHAFLLLENIGGPSGIFRRPSVNPIAQNSYTRRFITLHPPPPKKNDKKKCSGFLIQTFRRRTVSKVLKNSQSKGVRFSKIHDPQNNSSNNSYSENSLIRRGKKETKKI